MYESFEKEYQNSKKVKTPKEVGKKISRRKFLGYLFRGGSALTLGYVAKKCTEDVLNGMKDDSLDLIRKVERELRD